MPPYDHERRRRRNRRLAILGLIVLVLGAAAVSVYAIQRNRTSSADRQRVTDSIMAYEAEDYERVIELLEDTSTPTNTIRAAQGDAEAMWRYVVARREVPLRNSENIGMLFPALRQVVTLDPGNLEAGQFLLTLLVAVERNTEALDTAERLLAAHPDNIELLRFRYELNSRLNNKDAALRDAIAAAQLDPLDVRTQMDVATLMKGLNLDGQQFYDRAKALLTANPTDPRAEVIMARASLLLGEPPVIAQDLLRNAAVREAPSEDFARILTNSMDMIGQYEESYAYLSRVAGDGLTTSLQNELFLRDFDAEADELVIARAATANNTEAEPDALANILALTAISYKRQGQDAHALDTLARLEAMPDNTLAQHWVDCLRAWWQEPAQPGDLVDACLAATEDHPDHPYLQYLLAVGYRAIGEREAALSALLVTHRMRPSWAYAYYMRAELLLELDRPAEAEEAALSALIRRAVPAYGATYAVAQADAANPNDRLAVDRALTYIDETIQANFPGEPRTFVAAVRLLARSSQAGQAADRIRTALRNDPTLPQDALLSLADVSRRYNLGLEQAVYQRAEQAYGLSPQIIVDQAAAAARAGDADRALQIIRNAMPSSAPLPWRVVEAQVMDQVNDPGARDAWVRLADDFPTDLSVQRLALASVGVQSDRAFANRVIDRMREMGGPDSIGWKIERARYLLGSEDPEAASRQAAELLQEVIAAAPNRVEPYRLLARCQQLRGNNTEAARSLERAANLAPDDTRIQFQLGQLLHTEGQYTTARLPLLRVARNEQADPGLRLYALSLLFDAGEVDTLIPILEGLQNRYAAMNQQGLLLAQLYYITGRQGDADDVCQAMLRDPSPQAIDYAASYYWQTGRPDASKEVVELVNSVEMADNVRHTILARHADRIGERELAISHFLQAAQTAPDQVARWRELVSMTFFYQSPLRAVAFAKQAAEHHPDDAGLRAVIENEALLVGIAGDIRFSVLAARLVADDATRKVGLNALRQIAGAAAQRRSTREVAESLAKECERYPEYLELNNLTAGLMMSVGAYEQAAEIARRTMQSFPSDIPSAQIATTALAQTGQWRRTISAAQSWARRSPGQRAIADVYLSAAQRNLGRVDDALATIQPHVQQAMTDPDNNRAVLGEYAIGLVQRGRNDQAWAVIQPNLAGHPGWRQLALDLVGGAVTSARTAGQWLDAIEPLIAADAGLQRAAFAQACFNASQRLQDSTLGERARSTADAAAQAQGAGPEAWFLRAQIADQSGDMLTAEESYRAVIRLQPTNAFAKNNLAAVLVARGRSAAEAVELAEAAVAARPDDMNMQDTLALALSSAGRYDEALRVIELAIQRERQNLTWIKTKAVILEDAGRDAEAQRLRERFGIAP